MNQRGHKTAGTDGACKQYNCKGHKIFREGVNKTRNEGRSGGSREIRRGLEIIIYVSKGEQRQQERIVTTIKIMTVIAGNEASNTVEGLFAEILTRMQSLSVIQQSSLPLDCSVYILPFVFFSHFPFLYSSLIRAASLRPLYVPTPLRCSPILFEHLI